MLGAIRPLSAAAWPRSRSTSSAGTRREGRSCRTTLKKTGRLTCAVDFKKQQLDGDDWRALWISYLTYFNVGVDITEHDMQSNLKMPNTTLPFRLAVQ